MVTAFTIWLNEGGAHLGILWEWVKNVFTLTEAQKKVVNKTSQVS